MAAILFYSQMLYQLSYSRNCNEHPVLDRKKSINQKLIKRTESHYLLTRPPWKPKVMPPQAHNFTKLLFARPLCLLSLVLRSRCLLFSRCCSFPTSWPYGCRKCRFGFRVVYACSVLRFEKRFWIVRHDGQHVNLRHCSHFGSRYTLGCCDFAGLFTMWHALGLSSP